MREKKILKELSKRTSLPIETTTAVWNALRDLILEGKLSGAALMNTPDPSDAPPDDPGVVDRLIARAKKHPLGIEFLTSGFLATVAITLGAHAFTVEAARRRLKKENQAKDDKSK